MAPFSYWHMGTYKCNFEPLFFSPVCLFFGSEACEILVPWPGTERRPYQWKHQVLTTGLAGNSPEPLMEAEEHADFLLGGWVNVIQTCSF